MGEKSVYDVDSTFLHQQRRRVAFKPRPSRLSVTSKSEDLLKGYRGHDLKQKKKYAATGAYCHMELCMNDNVALSGSILLNEWISASGLESPFRGAKLSQILCRGVR